MPRRSERVLGELTLAGTVAVVRKAKRGKCVVAASSVRDLVGGPAEERLAQLIEEALQLARGAALDPHGLILALDLKVGERNLPTAASKPSALPRTCNVLYWPETPTSLRRVEPLRPVTSLCPAIPS